MYKVLVVDDDKDIIDLIRLYLERDEIEVCEAHDGLEAGEMLRTEGFDLAVIDIMLPGLNGFELIKSMRKYTDIPVIIMSAKVGTMDKVFGLEIGADDYITKPFEPIELAARVKAAIRRYHGKSPEKGMENRVLSVGELALDLDNCSLKLADDEIDITSLEFNLLKLFMQNPGRVFTNVSPEITAGCRTEEAAWDWPSRRPYFQSIGSGSGWNPGMTDIRHLSSRRNKIWVPGTVQRRLFLYKYFKMCFKRHVMHCIM